MKLSLPGERFIAAWEGFRSTCYNDAAGNCTIGYGHLVHYGLTTPADRRRWGSITTSAALELLRGDAAHALTAVQALPPLPGGLTQAQIDALCSLAYNCGVGALERGHAVEVALRSKPRLPWPKNIGPLKAWHERVRQAMLLWDHAGGVVLPGLQRRRLAEAWLFRTGQYLRSTGNPYANS